MQAVGAAASGRVKVARVPWPGLESTVRLPPSDSARSRMLKRPKPCWSADAVHFHAQGISAQAAQVAVAQRRAWLARGSGGLAVLGVNDPTKPTCLTGAWTTLAEDVALMGKHALVAGGDKGLLVYELQQHLYAPLAPPVMAGGRMTLSWPAMDEVRLQKTTRLSPADWQEGPQSEGTNGVFLPMTDPMAFFRLVQGDEFIPPDIPPD